MALSKSKIEYLTHVWNFYPGCNHWKTGICPVGEKCWAKGMANRFRGGNFEPSLHTEMLLDPLKGKQSGRRIGVCFTGDLFGDWVDPEKPIGQIIQTMDFSTHQGERFYEDVPLKRVVFEVCRLCDTDTFVFLTKRPQNLSKWGKFPKNTWVGASVCNLTMFGEAIVRMMNINASHKWLSFEPIMDFNRATSEFISLRLQQADISWVVIGGWSGSKTQPKIEWIKEIVDACDKANIPVFLKDNLIHLMLTPSQDSEYGRYFKKEIFRHELPVLKEI